MTCLELYFSDDSSPSLLETAFVHPEIEGKHRARRGSSGAVSSHASFRWTPAVQALSILLVKHASSNLTRSNGHANGYAELAGEQGSPAASLDYAITKQNAWVLDMFGVDYDGSPILKSLLRRHNSERKRPGPVILSIDSSMLEVSDVVVFQGNKKVSSKQELRQLAKSLEESWKPRAKKDSTLPGRPAEVTGAANLRRIETELDLKSKYASADPEIRMALGDSQIFVRRVIFGFALTLVAALFWGIGNIAIRWSAQRFPQGSFDIGFTMYFTASMCLTLTALSFSDKANRPKLMSYLLTRVRSSTFLLAALAKSINTYFWILSATLIPAAATATVENLHVVWTALAIALIFKERVPSTWIAGSVVVVIGAALITQVSSFGLSFETVMGLVFAMVAALGFSGFVILWSKEKKSYQLSWRTMEMASLMLLVALFQFPIHCVVNFLWVHGSYVPFSQLTTIDFMVQAFNGLLGTIATYFFLNEATRMLQGAGNLSGLLLGIGLSFAVPITLALEWLILGVGVSLNQVLGVFLFILGFTAVRASLLRREAAKAST